MQRPLFNPRFRSLPRANLIVGVSFVASIPLSHFPHIQPAPLLALPLLGCAVGTADTVRCMQKRWSWYHGGVILCIYADLMAITLILFFLLYPYFLWFSETR